MTVKNLLAATLPSDVVPNVANQRSFGSATLDFLAVFARNFKGNGATKFGQTSQPTTISGSMIQVEQGQIQAPSLPQGAALTLAATTAPNILATAAFSLTLPAPSASYKGMMWAISSAGFVVTYSGTFKYSTAKGTWTPISAGSYASTAAYLLHWLYCDGATWLLSLD